jgi:hypothetical protein
MLVPYSIMRILLQAAVFEARCGIIPEINLQFHLKQGKFLYRYVLAIQNEKMQIS